MSASQTQQTEWENPDNWSSRGGFGIYFSKRDPRIWVPKASPRAGWTVNLAHPAGVAWMVGLLLLPTVLMIGFVALAGPCIGVL